MKAAIHPNYFPQAKIVCACGANYETGSSLERIDIELCAACHPFFTGKQKILDTARRVEKFTNRSGKVGETVKTAKDKADERAARAQKKAEKRANNDTSIKSVNA
ncbi:MAG: 50S ribosomal protein L31 [Candidatus Uhrbacteria bacterium]|nr:50S ribosomal protein L31 [Candidatus Uhrbacteria bacterium]